MKIRYVLLVIVGISLLWLLDARAQADALATCLEHHSEDTCRYSLK